MEEAILNDGCCEWRKPRPQGGGTQEEFQPVMGGCSHGISDR